MKEYEKHVTDTRVTNETGIKTSYCGKKLDQFDRAFLDAEHMLNTIKEGSRLLPCPKCKKVIVDLLNTE